jgi:hypothetical protein
MIFNPSVTSYHPLYILLGKTPRKVTGYGREEGKYPQSIGADKSCSRGYFTLPLLIVDEIEGVPAGRGG